MEAAVVNGKGGQMHRRRSSKEEDSDHPIIFPIDLTPTPTIALPPTNGVNGLNGLHRDPVAPTGNGPPRHVRNISTPSATTGSSLSVPVSHSYPGQSPSAGPYRTTFAIPRPPPNGMRNGHAPPAMRQSLSLPAGSAAHSRTRSISGPYSPLSPSPLSSSFPMNMNKFSSSSTAPELSGSSLPSLPEQGPSTSPPLSSNTRRHSRLHSRNLSVFFPRPGSLPHTAIAEDGAQELVYPSTPPSHSEGVLMPSASPGPGQRGFRAGFTFGARPPSNGSPTDEHPQPPPSAGAARRGHHHKHSLSHNFFSFLEPGTDGQTLAPEDLHTLPAPTPTSPWTSRERSPTSPSEKSENMADVAAALTEPTPVAELVFPAVAALGQFVVGAWLWVVAQGTGSLACTGLGYWVVFDAFGVALGSVLPGWLARPAMKRDMRRPFGNGRIETVATFAQTVYLIFTSVYVCKETLEHLLLSSGEGHHHHNGDETSDVFGIEFPVFLLCATFVSLLTTSVAFDNHAKLASTANNHLPPLTSLLPSNIRYRFFNSSTSPYPSALANILSNPYALVPPLLSAAILSVSYFIPPHQHRHADLVLATVDAIITSFLAYPAAVAIGAVLLQTSPARGLPGGRMEAFLRAMREIERHPQILHLPAPHIWQLTPSLANSESLTYPSKAHGPSQSLVVTLELHVPHDLGDADILKLTRWACQRCEQALRYGLRGEGEGEAEVTVGVVRG